jgi:hypothetical protein
MLEQARFSLSRAGVMVGLCALLFLTAGIWFNTQHTVSDTYFSEQHWSSTQALLRHVKPTPEVKSPAEAAVSATCVAGHAGFARLKDTVKQLDAELAALTHSQFLRQSYQLDMFGLITDGHFLGQNCENIQQKIQWLMNQSKQSSTQFLQNLYWRERVQTAQLDKLQSNPWVAMPKSMLSMKSPWSGIQGCVYGTDAKTGAVIWADIPGNPSSAFCMGQLAVDASTTAQSVKEPLHLPSLAVILQSLAPWRTPQHPDHTSLVDPRHVAVVRGSEQIVGLHTQLSIDTQIQNDLQRMVMCYTASANQPCPQLNTKGDERFEQARVRMAGLALMDIPTGKVLAAVSAQSPCYLHDLTRAGQRPTDCPELPLGTVHKPRWPQAPDNHALFKQAAPGSLVKPLLMSGILAGKGQYAGLNAALQKSDSHLFLDAWLCRKELGQGPFANDCDRPQRTQHIAHWLGWNSGCDNQTLGNPLLHCGEIDLLWGQTRQPALSGLPIANARWPQLPVMGGRLLVQPVPLKDKRWGYQDLMWPQSMPTAKQRSDCANSARKSYTACAGHRLGIVSEGYGQGNALTTPVGVSGLLSALVNAADQQPNQSPHILVKVFRNDGKALDWGSSLHPSQLKTAPEVLNPDIAQKVIAAMSMTHQPGGTAHAACTGVWSAGECAGDLGIAGKTGTPGDADDRSIAQLQNDTQQRRSCVKRNDIDCLTQYPLPRPRYRWYAAVFKSPNSVHYDKALTVLVHSNWRRSDGRFADDQNAAAEMGMQAIRMLRERGASQ